MKSTGIVRRLDELGRITLPIELRRTLDVTERDPLEIYVDENKIILEAGDKGGDGVSLKRLFQPTPSRSSSSS